MTITLWPANAVAGSPSFSGQKLRQALGVAMGGASTARPLGARSGVRPGTPNTTVTATATTWTVKPHAGIVDAKVSAAAGAYYYATDANVTGAVTAAGASARSDLVYVLITDPEDGLTVPTATFGYTAGTPGLPATPAGAMAIATINVPISGGGSPTVTWTAPYAVAAGGVIPVRNTTERDALVSSASTENPITVNMAGVIYTSAGAAFTLVGGDDTGWVVPTLTNSWSSISSGRSVRYRRINGIVYLRGMPSGGTTTSIMVLPAGFRPAIDSRTLQQSTDSGTTAVAVVITAATGQVAASTGTQPSFDNISFPADL